MRTASTRSWASSWTKLRSISVVLMGSLSRTGGRPCYGVGRLSVRFMDILAALLVKGINQRQAPGRSHRPDRHHVLAEPPSPPPVTLSAGDGACRPRTRPARARSRSSYRADAEQVARNVQPRAGRPGQVRPPAGPDASAFERLRRRRGACTLVVGPDAVARCPPPAGGITTYAAALSEHPAPPLATGEVVGSALDQLDAPASPDVAVLFVSPALTGAIDKLARRPCVRRALRPPCPGRLRRPADGGRRPREVEAGPAMRSAAGRAGPALRSTSAAVPPYDGAGSRRSRARR